MLLVGVGKGWEGRMKKICRDSLNIAGKWLIHIQYGSDAVGSIIYVNTKDTEKDGQQ